jgi:hypothetical protein
MTSVLYSELLFLKTENEYKNHYIEEYCNKVIHTHDGIEVKFRPEKFSHAFFKNASRKNKDKSIFSMERAQRINWIKKVLQDEELHIYAGWDSSKKKYDHTRRVCLVTNDGYVVVLRMAKPSLGIFVTAYLIDDDEVKRKIESSPIVWTPKVKSIDTL